MYLSFLPCDPFKVLLSNYQLVQSIKYVAGLIKIKMAVPSVWSVFGIYACELCNVYAYAYISPCVYICVSICMYLYICICIIERFHASHEVVKMLNLPFFSFLDKGDCSDASIEVAQPNVWTITERVRNRTLDFWAFSA